MRRYGLPAVLCLALSLTSPGFFGYDAGVFNSNGIKKAETAKANPDHLAR